MHNRKPYIFCSLFFFLVEVLIATFFRDSFIRPIIGDYLVVILLYCLVRSLSNFSIQKAVLAVLIFSYSVEVLQWIDILKLLGLKKNLFTHLTLGSTFDWNDILAYTLGIVTVLIIEKLRINLLDSQRKKAS